MDNLWKKTKSWPNSRHLDLTSKLGEAEAESAIRKKGLTNWILLLANSPTRNRKTKWIRKRAKVLGEKSNFDAKRNTYQKMQEKLTLKAPRAGIVVNPPHPEEVGKQWERNQLTFCKIGEPRTSACDHAHLAGRLQTGA